MRAAEAVRLADELMAALAVPRVPSKASMEAPSETDMGAWDQHVVDKREKSTPGTRDTNPACAMARGDVDAGQSKSTEASVHFRRANNELTAALDDLHDTSTQSPGRYSTLNVNDDE